MSTPDLHSGLPPRTVGSDSFTPSILPETIASVPVVPSFAPYSASSVNDGALKYIRDILSSIYTVGPSKDSMSNASGQEGTETQGKRGDDGMTGKITSPSNLDAVVHACIANVVQALASPDSRAKLELELISLEGIKGQESEILDRAALSSVIDAVCDSAEEARRILDDPEFGAQMVATINEELAEEVEKANATDGQGGHAGLTKREISEKDKHGLFIWVLVSAGLFNGWVLYKLLKFIVGFIMVANALSE